MAILFALHVLLAAIWVGGMFFAYVALRPTVTDYEAPLKLAIWSGGFQRFFPWVWVAVIALPVSGYAMIFGWLGGMKGAGVHVHIMQLVGWIMILAFLHVYFAPYRRLRKAVAAADWPLAGRQLVQISGIVRLNLALGLLVIVVATAGRYL